MIKVISPMQANVLRVIAGVEMLGEVNSKLCHSSISRRVLKQSCPDGWREAVADLVRIGIVEELPDGYTLTPLERRNVTLIRCFGRAVFLLGDND